jgi:hypothetical protein
VSRLSLVVMVIGRWRLVNWHFHSLGRSYVDSEPGIPCW